MKLRNYLKDNFILITVNIFIIIFVGLFLSVLRFNTHGIYIIIILMILTYSINILYSYYKKKSYYRKIDELISNLDKKHLLSEMIEEPDFLEGKIFYKTIKKISKSMHDEIHKYKKDNIDYKEYIEMWVHEVKTPLSAGKLRARNIDSLDFSGIQESLDEIDHYVEQVLYYAKSSRANEDYIIKSNNLEEIVNESIKKNSLELIKSKVKIIKESLDYNVYTDKKWTLFIINQIIYNSIKYMNKEEKLLTFKGSIEDDNIKLSIIDNGIGISQKDINKVFKKGFTGKNGRLQIKSTGIGLYLCKKLCDKLGMQIKIYSKENKYTQVALFFPKSRATF